MDEYKEVVLDEKKLYGGSHTGYTQISLKDKTILQGLAKAKRIIIYI